MEAHGAAGEQAPGRWAGGTAGVVALSLLAVLLAAIPLLLLEPDADGGAPVFAAVLGIPAVTGALIIELAARSVMTNRPLSWSLLWWVLGVLPVGVAACTIPTVLARPEYFDYATPWGAFWTVAGMLLLVYLALLMGGLVWFFLVFPIAHIARTLLAKVRGDRANSTMGVGAFIQLALAAIILFGAVGLDGLLPGRAAAGQLLMALLGIPGSYQVASPAGLWIVRALVVGLVVWFAVSARSARRRARAAQEPQIPPSR